MLGYLLMLLSAAAPGLLPLPLPLSCPFAFVLASHLVLIAVSSSSQYCMNPVKNSPATQISAWGVGPV